MKLYYYRILDTANKRIVDYIVSPKCVKKETKTWLLKKEGGNIFDGDASFTCFLREDDASFGSFRLGRSWYEPLGNNPQS